MSSPILKHSDQEQKEFLTRTITQWLWNKSFNELDFEQIASSLNMSPRSLRRHLKNHGMSYKSIVQSERKRYAVSLIVNQNQSFENISKRLGYQDASSFSRAFKDWYGVSPSDYQSQERQQISTSRHELMGEVS